MKIHRKIKRIKKKMNRKKIKPLLSDTDIQLLLEAIKLGY